MHKADFHESRMKYLDLLIGRRNYLEDRILLRGGEGTKAAKFYSKERNALNYAIGLMRKDLKE